MKSNRSRYKKMEQIITYALLTALLFFIIFMIAGGTGIIWLKALTAIVATLISVLCIAFLFLSRELLRKRSIWMSVGAAAIITCIIFSLLLNYPSPNPYIG